MILLTSLFISVILSYSPGVYSAAVANEPPPANPLGKNRIEEWQEITSIEIADETIPVSEAFRDKLNALKNNEIEVKTLDRGISANLVLRESNGARIGVFRTVDQGGVVDAYVQTLDPGGFFDLPPVHKVILDHGEGPVEGWVQQWLEPNLRPPDDRQSLTDEIQKLAVLDVLLANPDRHLQNLIIREGKWVPIDHNLTVLSNEIAPMGSGRGIFTFERFLLDGPLRNPMFPSLREPFWLEEGWFPDLVKHPLSHEAKAFVDALNIETLTQTLQDKLNLPRGRSLIVRSLALWLKMASAANLPLHEIGQAVYLDCRLFGFWRCEDKLSADLMAGVEYDIQIALAEAYDELEAAEDLDLIKITEAVDPHLIPLFQQRIARLQGKAPPSLQIIVDLISTDPTYPQPAMDPYGYCRLYDDECVRPAGLTRAESSAITGILEQRLQNEYGSVFPLSKDAQETVIAMVRVFQYSEDRENIIAFFNWQLDHLDEVLLPGFQWPVGAVQKLANLPRETAKQLQMSAIQQAQLYVKGYREEVPKRWMEFLAIMILDELLEDNASTSEPLTPPQ